MRRRLLAGLALASVATTVLPGIASAHPLGNFTINHYAEIRVEPDRVLLDVVIDQAEIPAFQARLQYDTDGDGELSDDEVAAGRIAGCNSLRPALRLDVAGKAAPLTPGLGRAVVPARRGRPLDAAARVRVRVAPRGADRGGHARSRSRDTSFPERLGWREIVISASGTTVAVTEGVQRSTSPSARLTAYPKDLISAPLDDRSIALSASPGGAELAPVVFADATPVASADGGPGGTGRHGGRARSARGDRRPRCGPGLGAGRRVRGGAALDLRQRRPHAGRPADLAADRDRPRRGPRADAGPRQDPDGRLPGRLARDARSMRSDSGCRSRCRTRSGSSRSPRS